MNELTVFNNQEFGQVRSMVIDNEPWFIAKDIATVLGYSNTRDAVRLHVDNEDKNTVAVYDGNKKGNPNMIIINESGMYALIFGSRLQAAKKFKRWVTSEVLPALRKTGSYSIQGVPPIKNLRDAVDYIKIARQTAENNNCTPDEVAKIVDDLSAQFGIQLPRCFVKPKETTLGDIFDMIDYIYDQPTGRGHKKPKYEDYIAARTTQIVKQLNG